MRHFDVQLVGGIVLHQGKIAEMTHRRRQDPGRARCRGDLNALAGRGVHLVTVNDYLARRDPQWMGPIYHVLGLSRRHASSPTSAVVYVFEPRLPDQRRRASINLRPVARREAYAADITYGTNNEFGFDYLRDNMVTDLDRAGPARALFAIVDEVDNILIDEARTPLIICGQAEESADLYYQFARLCRASQPPPEARTTRAATTSST